MTAVALEATLARNGSFFPSVLSMHHWSAGGGADSVVDTTARAHPLRTDPALNLERAKSRSQGDRLGANVVDVVIADCLRPVSYTGRSGQAS